MRIFQLPRSLRFFYFRFCLPQVYCAQVAFFLDFVLTCLQNSLDFWVLRRPMGSEYTRRAAWESVLCKSSSTNPKPPWLDATAGRQSHTALQSRPHKWLFCFHGTHKEKDNNCLDWGSFMNNLMVSAIGVYSYWTWSFSETTLREIPRLHLVSSVAYSSVLI